MSLAALGVLLVVAYFMADSNAVYDAAGKFNQVVKQGLL